MVTMALCGCLWLGACTPFAGVASDAWPTWAGGMPKDVPPRPGAPGYEEFMAHQSHQDVAPNAAPNTAAAPGATAAVAPTGAAPGTTAVAVPVASTPGTTAAVRRRPATTRRHRRLRAPPARSRRRHRCLQPTPARTIEARPRVGCIRRRRCGEQSDQAIHARLRTNSDCFGTAPNGAWFLAMMISRHAGAQQIVEMHDADRLLFVDDNECRDLRGIEQGQRLARQLIGPHGLRRCRHHLVDRCL